MGTKHVQLVREHWRHLDHLPYRFLFEAAFMVLDADQPDGTRKDGKPVGLLFATMDERLRMIGRNVGPGGPTPSDTRAFERMLATLAAVGVIEPVVMARAGQQGNYRLRVHPEQAVAAAARNTKRAAKHSAATRKGRKPAIEPDTERRAEPDTEWSGSPTLNVGPRSHGRNYYQDSRGKDARPRTAFADADDLVRADRNADRKHDRGVFDELMAEHSNDTDITTETYYRHMRSSGYTWPGRYLQSIADDHLGTLDAWLENGPRELRALDCPDCEEVGVNA